MATRWSSEYVVAEHRDLQASAMAVDSTGTYVLLAGRRFLGVKKLSDSSDNVKKFPRQSKYEVGVAEWNPHSQHHELCALASNQRVEVVSWSKGSLSLIHTLCSHTRVVSDINWHQFDPNLIASCSIDTFTHIWDLRDTRRPSVSLSSVSGASQVRWNKKSRFLLATAHNGDVKLWDQRKGTAPVQYITAHLSNIHSLDWNPNNENQIATASQDCTVKFFDINNPRRAENILSTNSPVWRARYTPFGNGLLMVVVPPMRRWDNSLLLWNLSNPNAPVHSFVGHTDVVLEFTWRRDNREYSDYQLITWSKDQTLRIWQIEPFLQKLCGIKVEEPSAPLDANGIMNTPPVLGENGNINDSRNLNDSDICSNDTELVSTPTQSNVKALRNEIAQAKFNSLNVTVDSVDYDKSICTITARVENNVVVTLISFPPNYPHNVLPSFQFLSGTTIDATLKEKILKVVKQAAVQRVKRGRPCVEHCIKQVVTVLEQLSHAQDPEKSYSRAQSPLVQSPICNSFLDVFVPCPKTCGANFGNVGILVCFGRPGKTKLSVSVGETSQRSVSESPLRLPSFYYERHGMQQKSKLSRTLSRGFQKSAKTVMMFDTSCLFPIQRDLAEKYIFDSTDVAEMCRYNSEVAGSAGRRDLAQVWNLAALAATPPGMDFDEDFPWYNHPLSLGMIHSLIAHYAKQSDIQTAAMLCCAFGTRTEGIDLTKLKGTKSLNLGRLSSAKWWAKVSSSPYHTIHQVADIDPSLESWIAPLTKHSRSNSWSETIDNFSTSNIIEHAPLDTELDKPPSRVTLGESWLYDHYKMSYAEILHRWRLLEARTQVMKYVAAPPEFHKGLELIGECSICKKTSQEPECGSCKKLTLMCIICHTSVRGSANACLMCGHGGHTRHMQEWFSQNIFCPTGCGCQCLVETDTLLDP